MRPATAVCALVLLIAVPSPTLAADTTGPSGGPTTAENPFEGARRAEERLSFAGSVNVSWDDAKGPHSDQLNVRAAGGSIQLEGGSTLLAGPDGSTVARRPGGDWDLLWTGAPTATKRPGVDEKYDLIPIDQPAPTMVASRPTHVIEVRQDDVVRERLFVDNENELLLRREQLDLTGHPVHVVAFSSIDLGAQVAAPPTPAHPSDHSPDHLSSVSAPTGLPGGYRRIDAYREKGAVQVLYSDGLYDLSVFQQQGGLAARDVPASGKAVRVGSSKGWIYAWAGGQVLLMRRGHTVYSLVSEAPVDQLMTAAKALPAAGGSSLLTRFRRVCRNLVEPLAR